MFVPATSFHSSVCDGVFTHFKRDEDTSMVSGKLDEELRRMSDVVDRLTPTSMVLCNESFAATNEREGSEIARQVVRAMLESGVRLVFVTHLYDLAQGWYRQDGDQALFLRAERQEDGTRTYVLAEGEPLPTSFGPDLYEQVFGA
jgi:DNA mismatch repair ATPase MutS